MNVKNKIFNPYISFTNKDSSLEPSYFNSYQFYVESFCALMITYGARHHAKVFQVVDMRDDSVIISFVDCSFISALRAFHLHCSGMSANYDAPSFVLKFVACISYSDPYPGHKDAYKTMSFFSDLDMCRSLKFSSTTQIVMSDSDLESFRGFILTTGDVDNINYAIDQFSVYIPKTDFTFKDSEASDVKS